MTPCIACGQPFDNEHWLLGQTPGGDPELGVVRNMRCPDCWRKLREGAERNPSGCRGILLPDDLNKLDGSEGFGLVR